MRTRWLALLCVVALIAGSCSGGESADDSGGTTTTSPAVATRPDEPTPPTTTTTSTTTTTASPTTAPDAPPTEQLVGMQPRTVEAFADFDPVPLRFDEPPYGGPPTAQSLEGIYIPSSMEWDLDPRAVDVLERQGFVVVPSGRSLFHPVYQAAFYEGEVYFVTTDVGYHYLHLAFSKLLRELEQDQLLPVLERLVSGLVEAARVQRDELAATDMAEAADRVVQLYEAAATLLGVDVGPIGELAQREVELALAASELARSPITGLGEADPEASMAGLVDYSLFLPRGHYTRNADLERYFRAMSVLGNESFSVASGDTMLLAALATRVLVEDPQLLDAWELVYEPTAFLVGMADDYSPIELAEQLDALAPGWRTDAALIDVGAAAAAGEALVAARYVGIDADAASVRIMGTRFVIDSYIYDQLRGPFVGDPPFGRIEATPLDLVATFGSELAYEIMEEAGDTDYRNYDEQLAVLTEMMDQREPGDWAGTVYDAWLYALQPVWRPLGAAYPDFMQSEAWEVKDLQTGLGSYVELKHDTILYAKQSFAAEGDYQEPIYPQPRHWVEPNPEAFERMAAVVGLLEDGLTKRQLLPADSANAELIDALDDFLRRLARLASDELAGRPISADDNSWLESIGSVMEALWIRSSDDVEEDTGDFPAHDLNSAVIADIMRSTYQILEIGTGNVDVIYVLVPDDSGDFQVAKGAVYSYYEFWRDESDGRLTDEEWWDVLGTNPPDRPEWQQPLLPGTAYPVGVGPGKVCGWLTSSFEDGDVMAYWVAYGLPMRLDPDGDGIPCNIDDREVFTPFLGLPTETGLFCRDLDAEGYGFADAVAYWLREGAPSRMDADDNGVPCETVYPAVEIEEFFLIRQPTD